MVEKFEEKEHNKLVRLLGDYLKENGYEIKLDNITEFASAKPDMIAKKDKEILSIEVVNGTSINNTKTKGKWEALSSNQKSEFLCICDKRKIGRSKKPFREMGNIL